MGLCKIPERDFRDGLKIMVPLYKEYRVRDKRKSVSAYLLKTAEDIDQYLVFIAKAFQIMNHFWSSIKHLKEEVIISCVLIMTYIQMDLPSVKFNNICKSMGIAPSSAYNAINRYIIKRSEIGTFHGFKESSALVRSLLNNIAIPQV